LNVLRLLDESATNVMRHAAASTITIHYGMSDGGFFVSVADDGKGGAQISAAGNGLKNMSRRANAMNARLDIESGKEGTTVRLEFPGNRSS
jgi:signal transduction histidine kinase